MSLFTINASNAASNASSSPFANDAYLIVGSSPTVSGAGVSGQSASAVPTSTATTAAGPASTGYGVAPSSGGNLTGAIGGLLNNSTFWLAAGAALTLFLILRHRK